MAIFSTQCLMPICYVCYFRHACFLQQSQSLHLACLPYNSSNIVVTLPVYYTTYFDTFNSRHISWYLLSLVPRPRPNKAGIFLLLLQSEVLQSYCCTHLLPYLYFVFIRFCCAGKNSVREHVNFIKPPHWDYPGCLYSLDWNVALEYLTGLLDWLFAIKNHC